MKGIRVRRFRRGGSVGFTLIELLVVVMELIVGDRSVWPAAFSDRTGG
jgi:hypothetical protein